MSSPHKSEFLFENQIEDISEKLMTELVLRLILQKMSSTIDLSSDSSSDEGPTPSKRCRRNASEDLSFKEKVENILANLSDAAPGDFVVSGKLNAPMTTISIKHTLDGVVHFPLYENEASEIINLFEQSPFGKGQETVVDTTVRNSWELNPDGFEIMNPAWNDFVNDVVVAKIKDEMFLEFSFKPSLYKLLLYKKGSFFKPHRDSEKVDGMFATLVIQLPSLYKGGQLIVRHDGKTKTSDFSSTNTNNSFDTFFTAFYCDCEHEILKVTDGYRVCLVYNLISNRFFVPTAPRRHALELELAEILKDWEHRGKLVYALKHKYSESSLSFDNLKSTDRAISNFLIYFAKANDLCVFLGIFNKESSGQSDYGDFNFGRRYSYDRVDSDVDADFDSDDDDNCHEKLYSLSKLISVNGDNILTKSLTVNFKKEVIPEDCFANIEPYRKTAEPTGNAGVDVSKYYRSAAIVFWPKQFYLKVLREGGAASGDLDKVFLKEIESYRGLAKCDSAAAKDWANEVISSGGNKSLQVIRTIVEMKDIELMQSLFSKCVQLNTVSISLLVDVCEKYGWTTFSTQIPQMFEKLTKELGIQLLGQISTENMGMEKTNTVQDVLKVILKKSANVSQSSSSSHFTWYVRPPTMKEKMVKRLEEQEFLLSACRLAEKVNFDILDFAQSKSIVLFVPVLLQLVPEQSKTLTSFWKNITLHFLQQMQSEAIKPVVSSNWRRNTKIRCPCSDCSSLNRFLMTQVFCLPDTTKFNIKYTFN